MLDLIRGRGVYAFWTKTQRIFATCIMAVLLLLTPWLTRTALDRTLPVSACVAQSALIGRSASSFAAKTALHVKETGV